VPILILLLIFGRGIGSEIIRGITDPVLGLLLKVFVS
jgi:hypothetical protein